MLDTSEWPALCHHKRTRPDETERCDRSTGNRRVAENADPAQPSRTAASQSQTARPAELEDWLNARIYHPLARRLALALRGTFVTPNLLSAAGGLIVVLAAWFYASADGMALTGLAFGLHLGWHVLDGADGDLARLTGTASRTGEIIDGICDYASHVVLYLTLSWIASHQIGPIAWVIGPAAGFARIPQAVFYESQRRQYQFWVYKIEWLRTSGKTAENGAGGAGSAAPIEALATGYTRFGALFTPYASRIDALFAEADKKQRDTLRGLVKHHYRPVMRTITPLSSNYRTLAIGFSMLAGSPIYAFVFELVLLTIWLGWSMWVARQACARIIAQD